jgi:hypothetical protein
MEKLKNYVPPTRTYAKYKDSKKKRVDVHAYHDLGLTTRQIAEMVGISYAEAYYYKDYLCLINKRRRE